MLLVHFLCPRRSWENREGRLKKRGEGRKEKGEKMLPTPNSQLPTPNSHLPIFFSLPYYQNLFYLLRR
jgi:hypothetical protein